MYEDFIAERIAELRVRKCVSAREMSLAIGQNSSYINRIENRVALPSMQCFFYICEYLGVTPREFFDDGSECSDRISSIHSLLVGMDDEDLEVVYTITKAIAGK